MFAPADCKVKRTNQGAKITKCRKFGPEAL